MQFKSLLVRHLDDESREAPAQPSPVAPAQSAGGGLIGRGLRRGLGGASGLAGASAGSGQGETHPRFQPQVRPPSDTLEVYFNSALQPMIANLVVEEDKTYDLARYPKQRFLKEATVRMVECDPHSQARNDELGSYKIYSTYVGKGAQTLEFRGPDGGEYTLSYEIA